MRSNNVRLSRRKYKSIQIGCVQGNLNILFHQKRVFIYHGGAKVQVYIYIYTCTLAPP